MTYNMDVCIYVCMYIVYKVDYRGAVAPKKPVRIPLGLVYARQCNQVCPPEPTKLKKRPSAGFNDRYSRPV